MQKNEKFFNRIIRFAVNHSLIIIILVVLLTIVFTYFMLHVKINPEADNLLPQDASVTALNKIYNPKGDVGEYMMIAVTGKDPFTIDGLKALEDTAKTLSEQKEVRSIIDPFNMVTFEKTGSRLKILTMSPGGKAPSSNEDLQKFRHRILSDPFAKKLIISDDGKTLSIVISLYKTDDYTDFMNTIDGCMANLDKYFDSTHASGLPVLSRAVKQYLTRDLSRLLALAVLLILVIYYLGFRAKRASLLTFSVVGLGTIWCVGTMYLLGYTITIVSITTPPLVLTLGSSYSIHLMNQYFLESANIQGDLQGAKKRLWIADAIFHVNKTVLLAAGTTIIGFMSLLATKLTATKEFGISTSIGIAYTAILSFFFLPAILSYLNPPTVVQRKKVMEGFIVRLMDSIGDFVQKRRLYIFILLILVIVGFAFSLGHLQYETKVIEYFPQKAKVIKDTIYVADKIGGYQQFNLTLTAPDRKKNYFLDHQVLNDVSDLENMLLKDKNITKLFSFTAYLKNLNNIMTGNNSIPEKNGLILLLSRYIKMLSEQPQTNDMIKHMANEDFSQLTISIWVYDHTKKSLLADEKLAALVNRIHQEIGKTLPADVRADLWGESLNYISLSKIIKRDQLVTTILSFILVFILTSITFRSLKFGLFSIVPMLAGIMINIIFMVLVGIPMDMTTIMFSIVVIGVGVDNAIHLLLRFRIQSKEFPGDMDRIIKSTLRITGRPILITTASIVGGLLVFCFATFRPIIYFGLLVAMALLTAAIGTLIILPAMLSIQKRKQPDL